MDSKTFGSLKNLPINVKHTPDKLRQSFDLTAVAVLSIIWFPAPTSSCRRQEWGAKVGLTNPRSFLRSKSGGRKSL